MAQSSQWLDIHLKKCYYHSMKITKGILKLRPCVYIWWSKDKQPLYVGMSKYGVQRIVSHDRIKLRHIDPADTIEIWYVEDVILEEELASVLFLEKELIKRLKPVFNCKGNPDWHPTKVPWNKGRYLVAEHYANENTTTLEPGELYYDRISRTWKTND